MGIKVRWRVLIETENLEFEIGPVEVFSWFVFHYFCEFKSYFDLDEKR